MPRKPRKIPTPEFELALYRRVVFRVAQLFVADRKKTEAEAKKTPFSLTGYIAKVIKKEFPTARFTAESVWPAMADAIQMGFLTLIPPFELHLENELIKRYPHLAGHVYVVRTADPYDNRKVSTAAAFVALQKVKELHSRFGGRPIGVGLGPGRATRDFCESFGTSYPDDDSMPKLNLFAITGGGPAREPQYAPIAFFNQFSDSVVEGRVGLFAENLVKAKDLDEVLTTTGAKEAYLDRDKIDIIITSMGVMGDRHDLLRVFLQESDVDTDDLKTKGWLGNVQYRPYTKDGPVMEKPNHLRAVTLFELSDLVERAKNPDTPVILIARRCARCEVSRTEALRPLLEEGSGLKVFSDLILDSATCADLVKSSGCMGSPSATERG